MYIKLRPRRHVECCAMFGLCFPYASFARHMQQNRREPQRECHPWEPSNLWRRFFPENRPRKTRNGSGEQLRKMRKKSRANAWATPIFRHAVLIKSLHPQSNARETTGNSHSYAVRVAKALEPAFEAVEIVDTHGPNAKALRALDGSILCVEEEDQKRKDGRRTENERDALAGIQKQWRNLLISPAQLSATQPISV